MKFFEPNEKRNTVAVYVFLVALFSVLCVMFWLNISFFYGVLDFLHEVIKPLIYGFIVAFLLHPVVKFIETRVLGSKKEKRIGFRHFISVVIAYILIVLMLILFVAAVYPEIAANYQEFSNKLGNYIENFRNSSADFVNSTAKGDSIYIYSNIEPDLRSDPTDDLFSVTINSSNGVGYSASTSSIRQTVLTFFDSVLTVAGDSVKGLGFGIFSRVGTVVSETKNIILGIVLSFYFLLSEHSLRFNIHRIIRSWLPTKAYKYTMWLADKAKNIFRDYIIVRILDGFIVGALLFVCLWIFQTPFCALLALIMGFTSLFPFIGPIVGIAAGTVLLLVVDPGYAILYLVISVILNILDSRYVEPFLDAGRNQYKLAAIWIFAAIVIMGGLFGIIGIMLGIPLFAFIYSIIKDICQRRLRAKNLSENTLDYFARNDVEKEKANDVKEDTVAE